MLKKKTKTVYNTGVIAKAFWTSLHITNLCANLPFSEAFKQLP
jgi:hypothetical protein